VHQQGHGIKGGRVRKEQGDNADGTVAAVWQSGSDLQRLCCHNLLQVGTDG